MKKIGVLGLFVVISVTSFGWAAHIQKLLVPSINVPKNVTTEKTSKIIHQVLFKYKWYVMEEGNGFILAKHEKGSVMAEVKIVYNDQNIEIKYMANERLSYKMKNGQEYINHHYNAWVANLEKGIRSLYSNILEKEVLEK